MSSTASAVLVLVLVAAQAVGGAKTRSLDITTVIRSRMAETIISSRVHNNKNESAEIKFQSMLPNEAFITAFSMEIDGKHYDGEIREKEEAERVYNRLREKGKTTGIVRTRDESVKNFKTSVNVGPNKVVTFKLAYVQLLQRKNGKYTNRLVLLGNQLMNKLSVNMYICEMSTIKNLTVLPFINSAGDQMKANATHFNQENYAHVEFHPGDFSSSLYRVGGSFAIEYQLEMPINGSIVVDKDYFIHFFDPNAIRSTDDLAPKKSTVPRKMMFVLDSSGSMSGTKLHQLKEAMRYVINNLEDDDKFGIIDFDSSPKVWRLEGKRSFGNLDDKESALNFIRYMSDDGGTNILSALNKAYDIFVDDAKTNTRNESKHVIFLTDGLDSSSELFYQRLGRHKHGVLIHAVGFGNGVNVDFLKQLAARSDGTWTQIFEDSNAVLQMQDYLLNVGRYEAVRGLDIKYPSIIKESNTLNEDQMLEGGELMTIGRVKGTKKDDPKNYTITVKIRKKEPTTLTFSPSTAQPTCATISSKRLKNYLWQAYGITKVNEVLKNMDQNWDPAEKETLKRDAIGISLKYRLVSPVTAMIVITPEDKEALKKEDEEAAEKEELNSEKKTVIPESKQNKSPWWSGNGDPHFLVHLTQNTSICFNWQGELDKTYNLIMDPTNQISVNGQLTQSVAGINHGTFFSKIVIMVHKYQFAVIVTPMSIIVRNLRARDPRSVRDFIFPANDTDPYERTIDHITLSVTNITKVYTLLTVTIDQDVSFTIDMHHPTNASRTAHLDFIVRDTSYFDDRVGGVFGAFPKQNEIQERDLRVVHRRNTTYLWFRRKWLQVHERQMWMPSISKRIGCWFVKKFQKIFKLPASYYEIEDLFALPHYYVA